MTLIGFRLLWISENPSCHLEEHTLLYHLGDHGYFSTPIFFGLFTVEHLGSDYIERIATPDPVRQLHQAVETFGVCSEVVGK